MTEHWCHRAARSSKFGMKASYQCFRNINAKKYEYKSSHESVELTIKRTRPRWLSLVICYALHVLLTQHWFYNQLNVFFRTQIPKWRHSPWEPNLPYNGSGVKLACLSIEGFTLQSWAIRWHLVTIITIAFHTVWFLVAFVSSRTEVALNGSSGWNWSRPSSGQFWVQ